MPTYTYYCPNCEAHRDVFFRKISAARAPTCDDCNIVMNKAINGTQGFKFAVGGFSASSETNTTKS